MNIDWRSIVGTVAPGLASALGGPLAGMAVKALGSALLGTDQADETAVAKAVTSGDPDILLKMKQADLEFQAKLKDAELKLEDIAAGDRDSARKRQIEVHDWTPAALGLLVTAGFFAILGYMSFADLPIANREMFNIMLGALGAAWTSIIAYFFGSSAGSVEKTKILAEAVKKN